MLITFQINRKARLGLTHQMDADRKNQEMKLNSCMPDNNSTISSSLPICVNPRPSAVHISKLRSPVDLRSDET
jgi:hypothetical protein